MDRGRGCPLTSFKPRTSDLVLVLEEGFIDELDRVLDLVEGFLGELKLVLELVEGFLEELKLILVFVELFCLVVQQLCAYISLLDKEEGQHLVLQSGHYLPLYLSVSGKGVEDYLSV